VNSIFALIISHVDYGSALQNKNLQCLPPPFNTQSVVFAWIYRPRQIGLYHSSRRQTKHFFDVFWLTQNNYFQIWFHLSQILLTTCDKGIITDSTVNYQNHWSYMTVILLLEIYIKTVTEFHQFYLPLYRQPLCTLFYMRFIVCIHFSCNYCLNCVLSVLIKRIWWRWWWWEQVPTTL